MARVDGTGSISRWVALTIVFLLLTTVPQAAGLPLQQAPQATEWEKTIVVDADTNVPSLFNSHCKGDQPITHSRYAYVDNDGTIYDLDLVSACDATATAGSHSGAHPDASCTSTAYGHLGYRWSQPWTPVLDSRDSGADWATVAQDYRDAVALSWGREVYQDVPSSVGGANLLMLFMYYSWGPGEALGGEGGPSGSLDGVNKIDFRATDDGILAWAATWSIAGIAHESDQRYDSGRDWRFAVGGIPGDWHFQTLARHEAGHTFGLDHVAVTSANECLVMYPFFAPGQFKNLGEGDKRGIRALYP